MSVSRSVVCLFLAGSLAVGCSSSTGNGGVSKQCQDACNRAAQLCPSQYHDQAKCQSGCSTGSPGEIACFSVEQTCDLLQKCTGEGGGGAAGSGATATPQQCQSACQHAAQVCPDQFHDTAKCENGCLQATPGPAACLQAETTCALLELCENR